MDSASQITMGRQKRPILKENCRSIFSKAKILVSQEGLGSGFSDISGEPTNCDELDFEPFHWSMEIGNKCQ